MGKKLCRQCGKPVPANARRCPHCGARPRAAKRARAEAVIGAAGCIIPLVVILVLFNLCVAG